MVFASVIFVAYFELFIMLGSPLKPIEEERLKTIMRNNAHLQELGLKSLASLIAFPTVFSPCHSIVKSGWDRGAIRLGIRRQ